MNLCMLTLLYPKDQIAEVTENVKDKLQNQINNYQWAFIEGLQANLCPGEHLDVINALPVGIYPLQYRKLILNKGTHDQGLIRQLGCLNLPWLKQLGRKFAAVHEVEKWLQKCPENRTLLLYTQYLPYMQAVHALKRKYPDLKVAVIVTDLPNEMGLASGRRGILKKIEYIRGRQSLELCQKLDGFILLTKPMKEALHVANRPSVVIEGLVQQKDERVFNQCVEEQAFSVLYSGTLEPELGILSMLEAFSRRPEYELWICGHGSMQNEIRKWSKEYSNIKYFGFVPQNEALALQAKASALINPRPPEGVFTKYSFPSKTLEYLRSAKPIICYKLDGIPDDYDPYLCYIKEQNAEGILEAVDQLAKCSAADRVEMGERGRNFVMTEKNSYVQCQKMMRLLRSL